MNRLRARQELDYLRRREAEERIAATIAMHPAVREAHYMLAERYADSAWSITNEKLLA